MTPVQASVGRSSCYRLRAAAVLSSSWLPRLSARLVGEYLEASSQYVALLRS